MFYKLQFQQHEVESTSTVPERLAG
jgi:hypothetical protein